MARPRARGATKPLVAVARPWAVARFFGLLLPVAEAHLRRRAQDTEGDRSALQLFETASDDLKGDETEDELGFGHDEEDEYLQDEAYLMEETKASEAAAEARLALSLEADEAIAEMEHMASQQPAAAAVAVPYAPAQLRAKSKGKTQMLSVGESYGFFSEANDQWERRKAVHAEQMKVEARTHDKAGWTGKQWWQLHYEPSFHCSFAERLGSAGEGGKWVCDPYRIADAARRGEPCLVYSVGSRGEFSFEEAVQKRISSTCEVHIFDPQPPTSYTKGQEVPSTMAYHMWPLGEDGDKVQGVPTKSLSTITEELSHRGRRIDILKIDCEGCEWHTYRDWLDAGVDVRQILVELHGKRLPDGNWKIAHEFYKHLLDRGYVVANKEPNTKGCGGDCIEYGFLKLDPAFGKPASETLTSERGVA